MTDPEASVAEREGISGVDMAVAEQAETRRVSAAVENCKTRVAEVAQRKHLRRRGSGNATEKE